MCAGRWPHRPAAAGDRTVLLQLAAAPSCCSWRPHRPAAAGGCLLLAGNRLLAGNGEFLWRAGSSCGVRVSPECSIEHLAVALAVQILVLHPQGESFVASGLSS